MKLKIIKILKQNSKKIKTNLKDNLQKQNLKSFKKINKQ